jgi:hypothetical protein
MIRKSVKRLSEEIMRKARSQSAITRFGDFRPFAEG